MPYLSVDDVRLYYEESGSGAPLLFIHGLGSSGRDWDSQLDHFAGRYRVLRLDLRGHGHSECTPGPYYIPQFSRDVAVFLRKIDAVPAHVIGLSMGGMVAFELAADAPGLVRSLVVANSVADTRLHTWEEVWFYVSRRAAVQLLGMRRVGRILAKRLFVKPDQEELRRKFVRRWAANDRQAYLWSVDAIMRWSIEDRLDRMTAPTLLLASDDDYTPVAAKNRLAAQLPNATLRVFEDARHALPVEHPEPFNAAVDEFLSEIEGRDSEAAPTPRTYAEA